jgi:hypothetical protein
VSRREDVDNVIWGDPDFEVLSSDGKLLYLWSFTNPLCNMAGVYKVSDHRMSSETGLSPKAHQKALDELGAAGLVVRYEQWLWVRSRVKHLRTRTTQMARSIVGVVSKVPADHPVRWAFVQEYEDHDWLVKQSDGWWDEVCAATVTDGSSTAEMVTLDRTSREVHPNLHGRATAGQGRDIEEQLFTYWQERCDHPDAKFSSDRRAKVRARLREYSPDQIRTAIDGAAVAAFVDERGKRHDDLELICRSGSKLEDFVGRASEKRAKPTGQRAGKVTLLGAQQNCRKQNCRTPINNIQANNQWGLCDVHYAERVAELEGAA